MSALILSFECSGRELTVAVLRGQGAESNILASAQIDFDLDGPLPVFAGINDGATPETTMGESPALSTAVAPASGTMARATGKKTPKKRGKAKDRQGSVSFLIPLIDKLLKDCAVDKRSLDAICVGVGPGGFTGVRVAVVTARTLAQILDLPLIGVDCLESECHDLWLADTAAPAIGVVKKASSTHCFAAIYKAPAPGSTGLLSAWLAPDYMTYLDAIELLSGGTYAGAHVYLEPAVKEQFDSMVKSACDSPIGSGYDIEHSRVAGPVNNMAVSQAKIALLRLSLSGDKAAYNYAKVEPLYLRGASVTLKKGDAVERVESH